MGFLEGFMIGVTLATLITLFCVPKVREWIKLREIYLAPFRKWCGDTCGELLEFYERYKKKPQSPPQSTSILHHMSECYRRCMEDIRWKEENPQNHLLLIIDFGELHEVLKKAPKWIAKIKKEEERISGGERISNKLLDLMNAVDEIWHSLQLQDSHHSLAYEGENFAEHILNEINNRDELENIATEIWRGGFRFSDGKIKCKDFKHIIDYLEKKIP